MHSAEDDQRDRLGGADGTTTHGGCPHEAPKSLRHLKKAKKLNDTMQSRAGSKEWVVPGGEDYAARPGSAPGGPTGLETPTTLNNLSSAPLERTIQLYDFELWVANELRQSICLRSM